MIQNDETIKMLEARIKVYTYKGFKHRADRLKRMLQELKKKTGVCTDVTN